MCYYFCFIFSLTISTKSFTLLQTLRLHCISLNFSTFLVSSRFSEFYFVWGESYDWVSSMLERKVNVLTKKDDHWKKRSYLCFHVLGVEAGTSLVHSSGTRIINSPHQSLSLQEITHSNIIINYIFICTSALITFKTIFTLSHVTRHSYLKIKVSLWLLQSLISSLSISGFRLKTSFIMILIF